MVRSRPWGSRVLCVALAGVLSVVVAASTGAVDRPRVLTLGTTVDPNTNGNNTLEGVSCVTHLFCMAVGYQTTTFASHDRTLVERWNGTTWSLVASPNVGTGYNDLFSVSCPSTTFCIAVGDGGNDRTLIERWNGTTWSVVTHADPAGTHYAILNGVSCPTTTFCQAVGFWRASSSPNRLLADRWNGSSWATLATPAPHPSLTEWFTGVSCTSSKFCMAVGVAPGGTHGYTVADRWNGVHWYLTATLNPSAFDDLWGVSCRSATYCMAVGDQGPVTSNGWGTPLSFAEKWTGTWQQETMQMLSGTNTDILFGVSCASTTDCEAVGYANYATGPSWDSVEVSSGAAWTLVTAPSPATGSSDLTAISFPSATFLMAVGQNATPANPSLLRTIGITGP